MKKTYGIDVAVLLVFFIRPENLTQVFAQIKKVKPSRLYLYQDGKRNNKDLKNIIQCREIVKKIDWDCDVHTLFQDKNFGCDPSGYLAQKWMFETEDMGIILEDDVVPSTSFFYFCKDLLEKYKDDKRIYCISGMNHFGKYKHNYLDYIFTRSQSIWGWATWKRCIDGWDKKYEFLKDKYTREQLYNLFSGMNKIEKRCKDHKKSGIEYFETLGWSYQNTNHMLNIVPTRNLITNVGIGEEGTHSVNSLRELSKITQSLFHQQRYELKFPLRHPNFVIEDQKYLKHFNYLNGVGHPIVSFLRGIDSKGRAFYYSSKEDKFKKVKRLVQRIIRKSSIENV